MPVKELHVLFLDSNRCCRSVVCLGYLGECAHPPLLTQCFCHPVSPCRILCCSCWWWKERCCLLGLQAPGAVSTAAPGTGGAVQWERSAGSDGEGAMGFFLSCLSFPSCLTDVFWPLTCLVLEGCPSLAQKISKPPEAGVTASCVAQ